jgi:hypothetical protein
LWILEYTKFQVQEFISFCNNVTDIVAAAISSTATASVSSSTAASAIATVRVAARVAAVAHASAEVCAILLLEVAVSAAVPTSAIAPFPAAAGPFAARFFNPDRAAQDLLALHVLDCVFAIAAILERHESETWRLPSDPHVSHGSVFRERILEVLLVNRDANLFS